MRQAALTTAVSALAVSLLAYPGFAQNAASAPAVSAASATAAADKTAPKNADASGAALMKFSQDGNDAVREITAARVAIFDANTKGAADLLNKAKASMAKAEADAPSFDVKTTVSVGGKNLGTTSDNEKAQLVPVDGQLVLADDFVSTPEKAAHINKANEHLRNGKKEEALKELRLGEVAVMYNRAWLPIAATVKHLDQAKKLMDEHKYYEANLALKAIGDGMTFDSVTLTEAPGHAQAPGKADVLKKTESPKKVK